MANKDPYRFIGCRLKKDIYNQQGILLLREGNVFTKYIIDKLIEKDIDLNDFQEEIIPVIDGDKLLDSDKQEMLVTHAVTEIKDVITKLKESEAPSTEVIENNIMPVVSHLSQNYDLVTLMQVLQSKDDYTFRHHIGVAVLASLLAKWLKLSESEIQLVTLGGLLHDIGKLQIPDDILNKEGPLFRSEFELVKKHTIFGYETLKKSGKFSEDICLMALEHHEREDGNGYPHRKKGNEINYYSKIIAICDIYHAMTSDRVYRKAQPVHKVLEQLRQDSFGKLEPKMTNIFIRRIMEMSIGNTVTLNNGEVGEIIYINHDDPTKPIVKTENQIIDLRKSNFYIENLGIVDIAPTG